MTTMELSPLYHRTGDAGVKRRRRSPYRDFDTPARKAERDPDAPGRTFTHLNAPTRRKDWPRDPSPDPTPEVNPRQLDARPSAGNKDGRARSATSPAPSRRTRTAQTPAAAFGEPHRVRGAADERAASLKRQRSDDGAPPALVRRERKVQAWDRARRGVEGEADADVGVMKKKLPQRSDDDHTGALARAIDGGLDAYRRTTRGGRTDDAPHRGAARGRGCGRGRGEGTSYRASARGSGRGGSEVYRGAAVRGRGRGDGVALRGALRDEGRDVAPSAGVGRGWGSGAHRGSTFASRCAQAGSRAGRVQGTQHGALRSFDSIETSKHVVGRPQTSADGPYGGGGFKADTRSDHASRSGGYLDQDGRTEDRTDWSLRVGDRSVRNSRQDRSCRDLRREDRSDRDLRRSDRSDHDLRREDRSDRDLRRENSSDRDLRKEDHSDRDLRREDRLDCALRREDRADRDLRREDRSDRDLRREDHSDRDLRRGDNSDCDLRKQDRSDCDLRREGRSDWRREDRSDRDWRSEDRSDRESERKGRLSRDSRKANRSDYRSEPDRFSRDRRTAQRDYREGATRTNSTERRSKDSLEVDRLGESGTERDRTGKSRYADRTRTYSAAASSVADGRRYSKYDEKANDDTRRAVSHDGLTGACNKRVRRDESNVHRAVSHGGLMDVRSIRGQTGEDDARRAARHDGLLSKGDTHAQSKSSTPPVEIDALYDGDISTLDHISFDEWREFREYVYSHGSDEDNLALKLLREIILSPTTGMPIDALSNLSKVLAPVGVNICPKGKVPYVDISQLPDSLQKTLEPDVLSTLRDSTTIPDSVRAEAASERDRKLADCGAATPGVEQVSMTLFADALRHSFEDLGAEGFGVTGRERLFRGRPNGIPIGRPGRMIETGQLPLFDDIVVQDHLYTYIRQNLHPGYIPPTDKGFKKV